MYIDDQEIQRLYLTGLSDKEIAERAGCHFKSVARWRRVRGLKSNVGQGKRGKDKQTRKGKTKMAIAHDFDEKRALQLWQDCMTDAEIGRELDVPAMSISKWRVREGLESNADLRKWMKKQKRVS